MANLSSLWRQGTGLTSCCRQHPSRLSGVRSAGNQTARTPLEKHPRQQLGPSGTDRAGGRRRLLRGPAVAVGGLAKGGALPVGLVSSWLCQRLWSPWGLQVCTLWRRSIKGRPASTPITLKCPGEEMLTLGPEVIYSHLPSCPCV